MKLRLTDSESWKYFPGLVLKKHAYPQWWRGKRKISKLPEEVISDTFGPRIKSVLINHKLNLVSTNLPTFWIFPI